MSAERRSLRDVERTLRHHRERLRAFPNVVGFGVGGRVVARERRSDLAIRVYVSRKVAKRKLRRAERLPRRVRGRLPDGSAAPWFIPVDVVRGSGRLDALALRGGQGVQGFSGGVGTIGLVYRSVSGRDYLLTNAHVVAPLDVGAPQLRWRQRIGATNDVARISGPNPIAAVERITRIDSAAVNDADAALCWIYSNQHMVPRDIDGEFVAGVEDVDPRSAETYFYVNRRGVRKTFNSPDLRSPAIVHFGDRPARFRFAITLTGARGNTYLVEPGDSGSLLVFARAGALVAAGLVFAGDRNTVAVLPISHVLARLGAAESGRDGAAEDVGIA